MATIAVAGATGYAGRYLVHRAHDRGHRVIACVRDEVKTRIPGKAGAPSISHIADDIRVADFTDRAACATAVAGADIVISAVGRAGGDGWAIDFGANVNLLAAAGQAGATRFVYINSLNATPGAVGGLAAKAAFVHASQLSPVDTVIASPSGFFSDMAGVLRQAAGETVFLPPDPDIRLNPVHGADLADTLLDAAESEIAPEPFTVGGPDIFTYGQILDMAITSLGTDPTIVRVPDFGDKGRDVVAAVAGDRAPMWLKMMETYLSRDAIGEPHGTHHLKDFFDDQRGAFHE
ncbi:NAD(P)H-binding protein [Corynebacterium mendelii]|uniref:NAD(P)H-binding protein n=1 Tax=Corynebacterium mendelii TaxID=2765362 RepID=A0A939DZ37_9CORY|nr:NAD(P)H-binding protein [Corynebacterium mendelii]MBN9643485.1 NAD(P)H-binding protein [Corynebacterium mendelii]